MINQYSSNYSAKSSANFDNFIAIDSNQAAKSTAIEFALKQTSYNVLGISSSICNGATHLALAILNEIEKKDRTKETFYSSFERLAYNNSSINELTVFNTDFLNSKSLILIDSFYETSNKIFFNQFFDVLKDIKTKIIFTYNQGKKIPIVKNEIHLTRPTKMEKEIIIKNLLKSEKINFSLEIINYISDQNNYSVREIQGLVITVFARSILNNRKPDIEFVKRINNKMIINNHKNRIIAK